MFLHKALVRGDVKIPTYKLHTNHRRSFVRSHTLAPTSICDLSHSLCWSPLTDLGHISSVTYVCHPLWFVCGHRKGILTSPLKYVDGTEVTNRVTANVSIMLALQSGIAQYCPTRRCPMSLYNDNCIVCSVYGIWQ